MSSKTSTIQAKARPAAMAAALLASLTFASCGSTSQSVGIDNVDSLVGRVERVHVEIELSKQTIYDSIIKLGPLMAPKFTGDPAEAFAAFAIATEECEKQANELRSHVTPMRASADVVFKTWAKSLEEFSSPSMRERSQTRLDAAKDQYAEVQEAAIASHQGFDALNQRLRDMALFLSNDFNAAAVEEIREEAFSIRDEAKLLGAVLNDCMDAAAVYVANSALRGQVRGPDVSVEPQGKK